MFIIAAGYRWETNQHSYLTGPTLVLRRGVSQTPRRVHVGCRTRESVAPSANHPSRCPKEYPQMGLTMKGNIFTGKSQVFFPWNFGWSFLVDFPCKTNWIKGATHVRPTKAAMVHILENRLQAICVSAKQIWRIQSCNLTHNPQKRIKKTKA